MSNLKKSKEILTRYLIARIPFIVVNTIEATRTLEVLREISLNNGLMTYVHSLSKGIYDISSNKMVSEDTSFYGAIDFMNTQMQRREYLTMIFTDVPDLSTDNSEARHFQSLISLADEKGGVIICFSTNPIWNQLQRLGMMLKIDPPDEDEMYEILKYEVENYRNIVDRCEWDNNDIHEAAAILTGVTRIEAQNIIASIVARKEILKTDLDEIRSAKDRMFSDISGLTKIDVSQSDGEVGGLEGLRKWLDEKKTLMTPEKREVLKAKGLRPPRGILLVGVPGCGKSLSAKAIAANWKLSLYRLDFATVQGQYVGQTERQLNEAFATAENVAPCILWIDEIEKGLAGATSGSHDGGVSTRMVGQFLFWMQECKKQVFVVATANDVSKLPPELLRRGRFDEMFFVDLPTADERRDILSLYMKKYHNLIFAGAFADKVVEMTEGFTGADLESTVRDLAYRREASPNFVLSEDVIETAFNNVIPLSQTGPERIEEIREWGRERAVPASGRPIGEEQITVTDKPRVRKVLI